MKIFAIITGVITLISFVIQMNDIFPKYEQTFDRLSFVFLGILVGQLISFFDKNKIKIKKLSGQQIFAYIFYGIVGIAFIIVLLSILMTDNKEKISTLQTVLGSLGTFTFISFFFVLKMFSTGTGLYIDEKIALAERYFIEKNFSRSLHFYMDLQEGLDEEDVRLEQVTKRIKEIQLEQVSGGTNLLTK